MFLKGQASKYQIGKHPMTNYVLDPSGNAQPEPDTIKWAKWFEHTPNRILRQNQIGPILVSTVFLGVDHSFGWRSRPVLWETMIFKGKHDGYQERYSSREEALEGHKRALRLAESDE